VKKAYTEMKSTGVFRGGEEKKKGRQQLLPSRSGAGFTASPGKP
jgi:hypothetical protein